MIYTGAFSFGFSNGFLIYGVNNMATADILSVNTVNLLTANTTASGVAYTISGVLEDDKFGIIMMAYGASATANTSGLFTISAGDYQNAGVGDYTKTVGLPSVAVALDGARFRQDDGTIEVSYTVPTGVFYAFTF
jgi:hypothetical protein